MASPCLTINGRKRGMIWIAIYFQKKNANRLTMDAFDSITMTAEYKSRAVRLERLPV